MARKIIGLTGKMAAGKNYVTDTLLQMDILKDNTIAVDADVLVHKIVPNFMPKIIETFTPEAEKMGIKITDENGNIKRRELAKIVFSSEENLKKQEAIIHPEVERELKKIIAENPNSNIIVNATVLYKIPLAKECDAIIFIDCPTFVRLVRAKKRDGLSFGQIYKRFLSQKKLFTKYQKLNSDIYRVMNFGSKSKLERTLAKVLKQIISI